MPDVVAITGAAGALGSEVARHLVRKGYRAALLDLPRSSEALHALARELDGACPIEADFATPRGWDDAIARIERELGTPPSHGVLIAGGWQGGKPLHDERDDTTWRAMMDSNLETVHRSLRALLPAMVARRRGSLVVIGSRVAQRPWTGAGAAAYTASKAAAVALAQAVAAEVLGLGVRVNAVLPSTLDTPANRRHMPRADPSEWVALSSAAAV
ncbi:MAG TPA: SDR family NAD(P)-dependent oxidoreductase, partial [Opitutaceae bacterium]